MFKMKMKLHFRARHEHADSERRCTSDLKHALVSIDDANAAEDGDAPDFTAGSDMPTPAPGKYLAKARRTSASRS